MTVGKLNPPEGLSQCVVVCLFHCKHYNKFTTFTYKCDMSINFTRVKVVLSPTNITNVDMWACRPDGGAEAHGETHEHALLIVWIVCVTLITYT